MQRSARLFSALLIITSVNAYGQFTSGTRMAGASVGSIFFNSGNSDQTVTGVGSRSAQVNGFGVNLAPSLGWFISENTAVGFSFNLSPSKEKVVFEEDGSTFQKDETRDFTIGLGAFARNYFRATGSVLPFGQFSFDAGLSNRKAEGFFYGGSGSNVYKETYDSKSSGGFFTNAILSIGITKMVGKYTGLDLYAGYNFHYNKNTTKTTNLRDEGIDGVIDETGTSETIIKFTNHRFIIGLGFQIFLEKKKK